MLGPCLGKICVRNSRAAAPSGLGCRSFRIEAVGDGVVPSGVRGGVSKSWKGTLRGIGSGSLDLRTELAVRIRDVEPGDESGGVAGY